MKKIYLFATLFASMLSTTTFAAAPANLQPVAAQVPNTTPGYKNVTFATSGQNFTCDYAPDGSKAPVYVPYALCWNVVCDTAGPHAKKASCTCPIYNGPGWGSVPCDQRSAAYQAKNQIIYSEFSSRYLLTEPSLQPADLPNKIEKIKPITLCNNEKHIRNFRYADCWNQPCKPSADGKTANCDCQIIYPDKDNQVYMTEADNCQHGLKNCQQFSGQDDFRVVNGADLKFGPKVVTKSLDYYLRGGIDRAQEYFAAAHCEKSSIDVALH
jgi:hypothetical protein